jgi:hypothetical protein
VFVNGQLRGVYTNTEAVTSTFLDDRFYSDKHTFVFADNGGCDLRYKGPDSLLYQTPYTMKSDYGLADLRNLCDSLKNNISAIEKILDVDRTLWMLAYTNVMVILDSYLGASKHNYYIYEDHHGRFNPILWDLNGGMGIFNKLNAGGTGLTTLQMQNMSPTAHINDSLWPLVKNVLAVPMYKRMYIAHMKTIVSENIDNGSYDTLAQHLQGIIDTAIQSDPFSFYTYAEFLSNMNNTIVDGIKVIPGITQLMNARGSYLNATPDFLQVAPVISTVQSSNTFPLINTNVFITANVSNAGSVYLGWRNSVMERFTRLLMYDDGLNGDGGAGDGVYGISLTVLQPQVQYYIYAENNNAGVFSPQRAEHEYYMLNSNYTTLSKGDVVINELMAINTATVSNAAGKFEDWIELFNTTANAVSLDFLHLSDKNNNPSKWEFPAGMSIPPYGYQIIWADEENTSGSEVHCNFKLAGNGEHLRLSYPNGLVVDSVSFPAQTDGTTFGRYPNGTGPFVFMPPTFNAINQPTSITSFDWHNDNLLIQPNPSDGHFRISFTGHESGYIRIMDMTGRMVYQLQVNSTPLNLDLNLPEGMYICCWTSQDGRKLSRKMAVHH